MTCQGPSYDQGGACKAESSLLRANVRWRGGGGPELAVPGPPQVRQGEAADMLTCTIILPSHSIPGVTHAGPAHKYLILCSCQRPLIGLMLPEEQPKAALVADV